ncbi:MAG: ribonuclease H-like domain-containing protein [bacterium]|nr:ribonuclease H-like domain-containing protein [bacterium]
MHKVVLDIETKNTFEEAGSPDPAALDLSLLVVYDYEQDKYISYLEKDLPELWKLLEKTDLIIGFNQDYFDIPILNKYYNGDLSKIKTLDLLAEIKNSWGRRISLNRVASGTLGTKKSGHGLDAITWWKAGEIEKIRKYCEDDVRITKDVYEYALKHGELKLDLGSEPVPVKIDTSKWEEISTESVNFTLPF